MSATIVAASYFLYPLLYFSSIWPLFLICFSSVSTFSFLTSFFSELLFSLSLSPFLTPSPLSLLSLFSLSLLCFLSLSQVVCPLVAAFLHFFFLSSFCWVLTEAWQSYMAVTGRLRNRIIRKRFLCLGWGETSLLPSFARPLCRLKHCPASLSLSLSPSF